MSRLTKDFNHKPRELKQNFIQADFVIVGGGLAGTCAAISAAREGLNVTLVQDRPVLGGNASSEVRLWSLGATSHMGNNNRWAREAGIIGEILEENLYRNRLGNPVIFDTVLLEFVMRENNIRLLLNTAVFDAKVNEDQITAIKAFNSQNSTLYDIQASFFCDASGDGILGYLSGADYRMGAEDSHEFNEKFAPSEEYGQLMGHSIYFYTRDTDQPVDYIAPEFALKDITEIPRYRRFNAKEDGCSLWWIEYGGRLDTVHSTEEIKWELWKVVYGVWDHIKNSGEFPEARNMTLEWVGHIPGKRESRRFQGDYMLTQNDLVEQKYNYDAVSFGGWSIDLHPADGVYSDDNGCHQWHSKGVYQIPFRTMYSRNIKNLFVTGRLISASHVAFASTRVMLTCAVNGEAVGTAAALCNQQDITPKTLAKANNISALQQTLLQNGHYIPGVKCTNTDNLVSTAKITASSTYALKSLPHDGTWQSLVHRRAIMLPACTGRFPTFSLTMRAEQDTDISISLRKSEKAYNHTPEIVLDTQKLSLKKGEQNVLVEFSADWPEDAYAFICLSDNPNVEIALSNERITGVLSLAQKGNPKVALSSRQEPFEDKGFEAFDFWLPERRPAGKNFAITFSRPLALYDADFLLNGIHRPQKRTNAWIPAKEDKQPRLTLSWEVPVSLQQVDLHFDNDFDHPMETVQWGHPEQVTPFCLQAFRLLNDKEQEIYRTENNRMSHRKILLKDPVTTQKITLEWLNKQETPAAVFGIYCC